MYLVTPMVYEKLKNCLNKTDISSLAVLNKPFFTPNIPSNAPGNPPQPPYPFGKLDEMFKKAGDEEEKDEKPPSVETAPPEFEHPKSEMWEEQYFPTYDEPESEIAQMSFDDEPINWEENVQEFKFPITSREEIGTQTEYPRQFRADFGTQSDPPTAMFKTTQTDTAPQTFSQSTQTSPGEELKSTKSTQTHTLKKFKPKKKKQTDMDTPFLNNPPPPPPPPPPAATSLVPADLPIFENVEELEKKIKRKPSKTFKMVRQVQTPQRKLRNLQNVDYRPRVARHIQHFGLPISGSQSTQIVPFNPESRALVRYVPPQNRQPQISGISTAIPRFNIDEEYITPIPQPELIYRQPPGVTYESRQEIDFNQPPAITYREPLRLEYKPSPPPRPLKTYSRPQKRKIQTDDLADVDTPASKTLVIRKQKKPSNINLPKTYQKTKVQLPGYETFDGKMRVNVRQPQYLNVIDETIEDEMVETPPQQTPKFLCDLCGLTLSSAYNLARHKEREIKRQNRESDREKQFKLWFTEDGRGAQTKRTSTDAKFVPRQDKKRTAKEEFENWK